MMVVLQHENTRCSGDLLSNGEVSREDVLLRVQYPGYAGVVHSNMFHCHAVWALSYPHTDPASLHPEVLDHGGSDLAAES